MGIGVSIVLVAAGAILAFAVTATPPNIDLNAIGLILMIVGGVGLLVSLAFAATRSSRTYVEKHVTDHEHPQPSHRH